MDVDCIRHARHRWKIKKVFALVKVAFSILDCSSSTPFTALDICKIWISLLVGELWHSLKPYGIETRFKSAFESCRRLSSPRIVRKGFCKFRLHSQVFHIHYHPCCTAGHFQTENFALYLLHLQRTLSME